MIVGEVWKQKVFPILCQLKDFDSNNSYLLYIMMHHEAAIMTLLETIMFYRESCEAADDSLLDLVDYCHRKFTLLAGNTTSKEAVTPDDAPVSTIEDLQRHSAMRDFDISMRALPVLQYITDNTHKYFRDIYWRCITLCTVQLTQYFVSFVSFHYWCCKPHAVHAQPALSFWFS